MFGRISNLYCDPGEARTLDPLIKSQLLYQLSYGVALKQRETTDLTLSFLKCDAKVQLYL